jgi:hypothetical protein
VAQKLEIPGFARGQNAHCTSPALKQANVLFYLEKVRFHEK